MRTLALGIAALLAGCSGDEFTLVSGDDGGDGTEADGAAADASSTIDGSTGGGGSDGAAHGDASSGSKDGGVSDGSHGGGADAIAGGDATACPPCPPRFTCDQGKCVDVAASSFSTNANPSGNWTYGALQSPSGPFTAFTQTATIESTLEAWQPQVNGDSNPLVESIFSSTAPTTKVYQGTFTMDPGQLGFWPGAAGVLTSLRWTAPAAGVYDVDAQFVGLSGANGAAASTTAIDVYVKQSVVFSKTMNTNGGPNQLAYSATSQQLAQGDTLDFAVGMGTDGNSDDDPVGVAVVITAQ